MMKVFAFLFVTVLFGQALCSADVEKRADAFNAAILSAAIEDGPSIASASKSVKKANKWTVAVDLDIENYSQWPLTNPKSFANSGTVSYPPTAVLPGQRAEMVMRKNSHVVSGSYGSVSWEMAGGKRVVVMWSAPFNFNFYKNKLAVGILNHDEHVKSTTDNMYYNSGTFTRATYADSTQAITWCDKIFCVRGDMGTSHHPKVKVYVYPKDSSFYAPSVLKYIDEKDVAGLVG